MQFRNANAERGFSAMCNGALLNPNSALKWDMEHAQVFAHLMIGFNGPAVNEFTTLIYNLH
jgi:hypothetical protein